MNIISGKDLSYEILGCAFDAFKTEGFGFDEIRYHKVFHQYLLKKGIRASYKVTLYLDYLSERIAEFEIDEIVEDQFVIELKCIQTNFIPENYAQILSYLKRTGIKDGFLINFGLQKAYAKRIIFEESRAPDYEQWDNGFHENLSNLQLVDSIVTLLKKVHSTLGTTYHSKIYQAAFALELRLNKIKFNDKVLIDMKVDEIKFNPFEIDYWLIEDSILVGILVGTDKPRAYDLLRMRSYLRKLYLHHGLIAYWSTKNLQLYGIYES